MARFPGEYKKSYKLSDVYITPDKSGRPRGTGTDLSGDEFVLYVGSAPLERMVALKAFISSFKLNFQKEKEVKTLSNQDTIYVQEKEGSLSYDVVLNLPAHSTNESRNNLAKIEELQRLIGKGKNWSARKTYEEREVPSISNPDKMTKVKIPVDVSYDNISSKYKTTMPLFFVFFTNLINGGRKFKNAKINSFDDLGKKGFPCYIEGINYEPDTSAGYFEFDNYLYPRNIKLTLRLNYESESLFDFEDPLLNNKTLLPFSINGEISKYDSGLFPFHVGDYDAYVMNYQGTSAQGDYTRPGFPELSYLFIASAKNTKDFDKSYENKITSKESMPRYVLFDLFLEEFSRDLQYSVKKSPAGNSTVYSKLQTDTTAFKSLKHSIKINVVAGSLLQSKQNAAKLQYLSRMFFKTFYDGTSAIPTPTTISKLTTTESLQSVLVYIPTMIERPSKSKEMAPDYEPKEMIKRALPMYLEELSFDVNMDLGFFQDGDKLYPKAYSLNLSFLYLKKDLIVNYHADYLEDDDPQWSLPPLNGSNIIDGSNSWLFPYNRKTVKIGGS